MQFYILQTPEIDIERYSSVSKSSDYKTHSQVAQSQARPRQDPFSAKEEVTFGKLSGPDKRGGGGGGWGREKTSMDGIMTGRYSKGNYRGGHGESAMEQSGENLNRYNSLLSGISVSQSTV